MNGKARIVSDEEVLEELRRVLSSPAFEASERNRRFLRYVVEETLGGRADRIKAYTIATSVFGRSDDFDPMQDSIVRIEAARLRRAIERFYLKRGPGTGVCISIPKGAYVPEFLPFRYEGRGRSAGRRGEGRQTAARARAQDTGRELRPGRRPRTLPDDRPDADPPGDLRADPVHRDLRLRIRHDRGSGIGGPSRETAPAGSPSTTASSAP